MDSKPNIGMRLTAFYSLGRNIPKKRKMEASQAQEDG